MMMDEKYDTHQIVSFASTTRNILLQFFSCLLASFGYLSPFIQSSNITAFMGKNTFSRIFYVDVFLRFSVLFSLLNVYGLSNFEIT